MSQTMITGENKFLFVAPMFNAEATLPQLLYSLYGQSYKNWHLILIDDVSDPVHVASAKDWLDRFEHMNVGKVTTIWNTEKKWEVSNVLKGISMCDDNDIVCRIDADDWLTDLDALTMLDSAYTHTGCDALWTMHRWGFSDKNISADMPGGVDPYKYPWVSSHLKTFRKRLLNSVNDVNYRAEDGNYIKRAGDQAIYLPVLKNASRRVFLPRCIYHYTIDDVPETYQTLDAKFQRDEAMFLRERGYVK
jgi:glycosyltransferase involved in cell wall biosynthesis